MSTPLGRPSANATNLVNAPTLPNNDDKVGVFTTAQSLVTFSGATAAVTTIWKVLGRVNSGRFGPTRMIVPVSLALAIGLIIFLTSVTKNAGWKSTLTGLAIAITNSFTIAAAALGIAGP